MRCLYAFLSGCTTIAAILQWVLGNTEFALVSTFSAVLIGLTAAAIEAHK